MNSENIYGQQHMHLATQNGNSEYSQNQLVNDMASMGINKSAKYPQQDHYTNQPYPPSNQMVYPFKGANAMNNNSDQNNCPSIPPIESNKLTSHHEQPKSTMPYFPYNPETKPVISQLPQEQPVPHPTSQPQQPLPHPMSQQPYMLKPLKDQEPILNTGTNNLLTNTQNVSHMPTNTINQQNPNNFFAPQYSAENKPEDLKMPTRNQNVLPTLPPGTVYPAAQEQQQGIYTNEQRNFLPQRYPNMPGNPPPKSQPPQYPPYQPQQMMPSPPSSYAAPPVLQNQPIKSYNPPGMYSPTYQQQPAPTQRRLDPDQMPNPIQVMVENQRQCGGVFVTNQAGLLPPLVTTKYIIQDQGNSSPRFVRSSLYNVPTTSDILKQTGLPFALVISPFAKTVANELEPPIVNFGELGPIRCIRCKAYMSPNMQFIDAGRRFQCLLCKATTEVPAEYFQHLDHTGQRVDKFERPELVLGTYEFVATKDYCRDNVPPNPPALIFVIDVSYNNIKSGLLHLLCRHIKDIISNLPIDKFQERTKMKVGFITYNSVVHFYNIKSCLAQPQMMVVGDTQEMFMPLLDGFLCDAEESSAVIDALMEQIPKMFGETKETETILLPAIQAGLEALKASNCPGKLLVFHSTLPVAEAPGKLKNRDDRKLLGTDKEKSILTPQIVAYNTLGQECVQSGCSVDLFLFNNSYIDIATIGQVARLSGGEVYKYTYFQADIDGERLINDICENIRRPIAFDGVMRVRTSAGVRPTDFFGHYFMSNTTDLELASIDCNKAIAIEIKHDDKLNPEDNIYIQIALLYTSCGGQRRLRIINLALKTTSEISEVFKSCDLDTMILFFAKQSMFKLMDLTPKTVKDNLIHRSAQILACYRKNCTSPTSAGQLILPECLKLLPVYISCMIKNDALSGGSDMTCDDRSYVIQCVLVMDLPMSVFYFYPRLIPIHNVNLDEEELPLPIRCTYEKMQEDGAYILENGIHMFIWLGLSVSPEFLKALFGIPSIQQVNVERFQLSQVPDSSITRRIKQIISIINKQRSRYMRITIVRQHDKLENVFKHYLVEDRGIDGSASYVDFLCHMHKEIKELLS